MTGKARGDVTALTYLSETVTQIHHEGLMIQLLCLQLSAGMSIAEHEAGAMAFVFFCRQKGPNWGPWRMMPPERGWA
jgi:hypothetical protein